MAENPKNTEVTTFQQLAELIMEMNIQLEKRYMDLTETIIAFTRSLNRKISETNKRVGDQEIRIVQLEKEMKLVKKQLNID